MVETDDFKPASLDFPLHLVKKERVRLEMRPSPLSLNPVNVFPSPRTCRPGRFSRAKSRNIHVDNFAGPLLQYVAASSFLNARHSLPGFSSQTRRDRCGRWCT